MVMLKLWVRLLLQAVLAHGI